jgi:phosphatidylglycerophosphate synthase
MNTIEKPPSEKTIMDFYWEQYHEKTGRVHDLYDFKVSPYTSTKTKFFTFMGGVLVYFLLNTKVKPDTISAIYCILGFLAGVLLAVPYDYCILAALFITYLKGILDWTDGLLARNRGETSMSGFLLDAYGGKVGTLSFFVGLGFYVAAKNGSLFWYYLIPIVPFAHALILMQFGKATLFVAMTSPKYFDDWKRKNSEVDSSSEKENAGNILKSKYKKYYDIMFSYLDDRARTMDLICLVILLELYFPLNISWIIFLLLVVKWSVVFLASVYVLCKGGWAESNMEAKLNELDKLFSDKTPAKQNDEEPPPV